MFEKGQARTLWNELKALWDPFVRFTIEMALVPFLEILASRPIRDQPNLVGGFLWAEHIESHKTGGRFDRVRPVAKRLLHRWGEVICNNELTERHEHARPRPALYVPNRHSLYKGTAGRLAQFVVDC